MFLKCQTELTFVMYSRCIHTENSFSFTVLVGNVKKKQKQKPLSARNTHHTRMEFLHLSKTTQFTDANINCFTMIYSCVFYITYLFFLPLTMGSSFFLKLC